MRFFDEEVDRKANPKETVVIIPHSEAQIIMEAMNEFVKNNPRRISAKKLLKAMDNKWGIYG